MVLEEDPDTKTGLERHVLCELTATIIKASNCLESKVYCTNVLMCCTFSWLATELSIQVLFDLNYNKETSIKHNTAKWKM